MNNLEIKKGIEMNRQAQIQALGERELAKIERKEKKHNNYMIVAQKFAELTQEATNRGESCSIVAWLESDGTASGEIFEATDGNPGMPAIKIVEERTGQKMHINGNTNPNFTHTCISSSFRVNPGEDYLSDKDYTRYEICPGVSTWQGKILNKALENLEVPNNVIFFALYMDCRGVNGITKIGKKNG